MPLRLKAGRLPDYVGPGLRVLFVGINPGTRSSKLGHHFAGYSNRFWKLLYEAELVTERLTYEDDRRLLEWGFGMTNLVDRPTPGIDGLKRSDYADGRKTLLIKIRRYRPQVVALLGITVSRAILPQNGRHRATVGAQIQTIAGTQVFVLPNPSGRNAHYSYSNMLNAFLALKEYASTIGQDKPG